MRQAVQAHLRWRELNWYRVANLRLVACSFGYWARQCPIRVYESGSDSNPEYTPAFMDYSMRRHRLRVYEGHYQTTHYGWYDWVW